MWVVTIHNCDGSTAEAMDAQWSFGGFETEKDASGFAEAMYGSLTAIERHTEWYTQHFEVPEIQKIDFPRASRKQFDEPGFIAIDTMKLARQLIEDDGPKFLPPPPAEEDVQGAIASILGKREDSNGPD